MLLRAGVTNHNLNGYSVFFCRNEEVNAVTWDSITTSKNATDIQAGSVDTIIESSTIKYYPKIERGKLWRHN